MMPGGGGGFDPSQLSQMMERFGISVEEVDDVERVVIEAADKDIVIEPADVSIMDAQGTRTFQITGDATEHGKGETEALEAGTQEPEGPAQEDIELVQEQAGVDEETAIEALEEAGGEPAQAIMDLTEG
jgi:nascent polypeptide-associated complex subunit alpha